MARLQADRRTDEATYVGRYLFYFPGHAEPLRVAIDHNDARGVRDRQAYKWTDVYFRVNRWPNPDYGPKVRPLVTGNGALDQARLKRLVALRDTPRGVRPRVHC